MFKFLFFVFLFYLLYKSVYQPFVLMPPRRRRPPEAAKKRPSQDEYTDYEEIQ